MAFNPIPENVRKVWDSWNLRGFILLSLSLQTILILFAPYRKRTSNGVVIFVVWSAYLLADWAAAFAVGLISNSQDNADSSGPIDNGDLLAFWAPFLLVHLGGPDTITAFALEDNALWLRHLIGLIFQVFAASYVFLQTLPKNKLLIPTVVMLLAGIIKYVERTRGLYLASLDRFKESMLKAPDPGPNYAKLMDEYASKKQAKLPTRIDMIAEPKREDKTTTYERVEGDLTDTEAVKHAYHFFNIFKGLIVDLIFSFRERNDSREFFQDRTAKEAFKVILIELNFMYEVLFTKVVVVHSTLGSIFRFTAFAAELVALVLFARVTKSGFHRFDVRITYLLLVGALALDLIATSMVIFSDWTVAILKSSARGKRLVEKLRLDGFINYFLAWKDPSSLECKIGDISFSVSASPAPLRRWGESISAYNLIARCIKEKARKIPKPKGFWGHLFSKILLPFTLSWKAVSHLGSRIRKIIKKSTPFLAEVWKYTLKIPPNKFLFDNYLCPFFDGPLRKCLFLLRKTPGAIVRFLFGIFGLSETYDQMRYSSKNPFLDELWEFIFKELTAKSLLADDADTAGMICKARGNWILKGGGWESSCKELIKYVEGEYDRSILMWHIATEICYNTDEPITSEEEEKYREYSKILSDYMLYLLVMQPTMVSAVAGIGQIRFRDTCAEAKKFFRSRGIYSMKGKGRLKEACKRILEVNTDVEPIHVKGDRSKSVVFDSCILAKKLQKLKGVDKWDVMSKVWVEILSYAASHCRADTHAQVLSKGGELITLVWLLMAHLGIGEQFQINEGHARAKLVVGS